MNTNDSSVRSITQAVAGLLADGTTAALITLIEGSDNVGGKLLVREAGTSMGSLGSDALDQFARATAKEFLESRHETRTFRTGEVRLLFERIRPEPRLVVCGAGHVGASLAKLAAFVGYRVTLIDDRQEFVSADRFADSSVELVFAENWTDAVREAIGPGGGVAVAVVTRGHNEDEECMRAVMTTRPDYVGLIGSKRRTSIVLERLRQAGATSEQLNAVRAPIGLDIGAITPEEVALAIVAEIVSERRGGKGGQLSSFRRPVV